MRRGVTIWRCKLNPPFDDKDIIEIDIESLLALKINPNSFSNEVSILQTHGAFYYIRFRRAYEKCGWIHKDYCNVY
jgi:hypothetical protein